jgi:hypothetical protein
MPRPDATLDARSRRPRGIRRHVIASRAALAFVDKQHSSGVVCPAVGEAGSTRSLESARRDGCDAGVPNISPWGG